MVYLGKINAGETETCKRNNNEPVTVTKPKNQVVVPVGQNDKNKPEEADKLPKGCYVEKNDQESTVKIDNNNNNNNDDDDIDTSVNPDERISILPSIAINTMTNEVTDAMEHAVERATAQMFVNSSNDSFYKAQDMLQNSNEQVSQTHKYLNDINMGQKRFNVYGKVVYEGVKQSYKNNDPSSETLLSRNSEKADLGINWRNKSGNTKVSVFGSYTHTKTNMDIIAPDGENFLSESGKDDSYGVYAAAEHRFKKGDLLMGNAFHIDDAETLSKMTSISAGYFFSKYNVLAEGKTSIHKFTDTKSVTKTDFSISLNPDLSSEQAESNMQSVAKNETTPDKESVLTTNPKKWSTSVSPFFETGSVGSSTEEGLGLKVRSKRADVDSTLRISTFGKISTTQQEESNKYHVTFGSGIKYTKKLGAKSLLEAKAEVKDRYTMGKENIFTASAHALYTSSKFSAEVEAKKIAISGQQPVKSYSAVVGRGYYTPSKKVNLYAEAGYTALKEESGTIKGTNVQAGVIVNF